MNWLKRWWKQHITCQHRIAEYKHYPQKSCCGKDGYGRFCSCCGIKLPSWYY